MKAVIWTAYGSPDVLQLKEIARPVPADNEILIRICATTVTAGDCEARSLNFMLWLALLMRLYMGLRRPIRTVILGQELAGEVEAVGKNVKHFKPGDLVFGTTGIKFGAYAEYICLAEESEAGVLALKPVNMTFEEAAALPAGGLEALHFLRKANIRHGEKVLINGAGGGIGTFAVQLARYFGAEVTAVDSTDKLEMLRSIGADHVIDYMQEDFTRNGETYDVILDVPGKTSFSRSMQSLNEHGRYLLANPSLSGMVRGAWTSGRGSRKIIFEPAKRDPEDLIFLKELAEAGSIKTVIDRTCPLEQTADAHRYVETGQKKGNVIITPGHQPGSA